MNFGDFGEKPDEEATGNVDRQGGHREALGRQMDLDRVADGVAKDCSQCTA